MFFHKRNLLKYLFKDLYVVLGIVLIWRGIMFILDYIDKIFVSEGKFVNKDDLLIKFDDREYQIAISEAEVNLMNAKIEYGFYTKEVAQNIDANLADSVKVKLEKLEVMFKENKINKEEYLNTKEKLDLALLFAVSPSFVTMEASATM